MEEVGVNVTSALDVVSEFKGQGEAATTAAADGVSILLSRSLACVTFGVTVRSYGVSEDMVMAG